MAIIKRTYHMVAAFALLNLFALIGGILYLYSSGALTPEKARAMFEVIHPPELDEAELAEGDAGKTEDIGDSKSVTGAPPAINAITPEKREIARLNLQRLTQNAEDRLRYASRMMVDIERKREALAKEAERLKQAQAEQAGMDADEVFQKDLEIVSLMKPKVALDNLLARPVNEAARVLQELDSRKGKKIIEAASKDPRKWQMMLRVQDRMRETGFDTAANASNPETEEPTESQS